MKIEEIVKALRCISTAGDKEENCEHCPFYTTEKPDVEVAEKVWPDEWTSCDCDAVDLAAADVLETLLDRCARYAEEIAVLQERQRWIPVTERLPEVWRNDETMELVNYMIYSPDFGVDIGNYHSRAKKWLCMGLPCTVTHWMPLPEAPEVE